MIIKVCVKQPFGFENRVVVQIFRDVWHASYFPDREKVAQIVKFGVCVGVVGFVSLSLGRFVDVGASLCERIQEY